MAVPDWYVARTKPRKERVAEINLANQGIEAFLPQCRVTRRRFNGFEDRLEPLFPGYIFFQSGRDPARWRAVGGTMGLQYVIWGSGRAPRPVPSEVMDELIAGSAGGIVVAGSAAIAPGDEVKIQRGPFTGFLAKVRALDPRGRVQLLLEAMGGAALTLERAGVQRA